MRFEPLARFDTELTACSVEICPATTRGRYLVCGLYQNAPDPDAPVDVESPKTKRTGRLLLFYDEDGDMRVLARCVNILSVCADV